VFIAFKRVGVVADAGVDVAAGATLVDALALGALDEVGPDDGFARDFFSAPVLLKAAIFLASAFEAGGGSVRAPLGVDADG
jgi:hypothetical protein